MNSADFSGIFRRVFTALFSHSLPVRGVPIKSIVAKIYKSKLPLLIKCQIVERLKILFY